MSAAKIIGEESVCLVRRIEGIIRFPRKTRYYLSIFWVAASEYLNRARKDGVSKTSVAFPKNPRVNPQSLPTEIVSIHYWVADETNFRREADFLSLGSTATAIFRSSIASGIFFTWMYARARAYR